MIATIVKDCEGSNNTKILSCFTGEIILFHEQVSVLYENNSSFIEQTLLLI